MIKLLFKTILFTLLLASTTLVTKAQIGYDYAQYGFALGVNANKVYGDAESVKTTPSGFVNFTYNQTPFINYIVEAQAGQLEGGSVDSKSGRYFKNNYAAVVFRGQLQAGELIDYSQSRFFNALKNLYLSAGIGYLINDIRSINRTSYVINDYTTGGEDKSNELFIPARVGYELKFFNKYNQPSFKVDLGVQYNLDLNDNMDGFTAGVNKDKLLQYSIGFKFALGGVISYRKQIHY
ncbi:hypothetical protein [Mucilaginibacter segetis]|uniref:Outer membrane protein beta-barrel domain-containing protein n=1 Tax=Mucilaginibacter segetis TaxID=2793071 RepID=A0A934PX34_9SPHI|nr:hypothetical protein [Mucilaginibacter segetis]MBK0380623.1 hypothetical protein [Mucilaginibacter segetis]